MITGYIKKCTQGAVGRSSGQVTRMNLLSMYRSIQLDPYFLINGIFKLLIILWFVHFVSLERYHNLARSNHNYFKNLLSLRLVIILMIELYILLVCLREFISKESFYNFVCFLIWTYCYICFLSYALYIDFKT